MTTGNRRSTPVCLADQSMVAPDECVECGGWLHVEVRDGYPLPAPDRFRVCSQDCVEGWVESTFQFEEEGVHA